MENKVEGFSQTLTASLSLLIVSAQRNSHYQENTHAKEFKISPLGLINPFFFHLKIIK